mmetsp:Transcript_68748/g.76910  ORF Transcript_68748/g.76910 Transcript_68748/m.76910 type:complete len:1283 (+) Transcript_68748:260-4108(+)
MSSPNDDKSSSKNSQENSFTRTRHHRLRSLPMLPVLSIGNSDNDSSNMNGREKRYPRSNSVTSLDTYALNGKYRVSSPGFGRIRRLSSTHVRPRPEILTDFSSLNLPSLQQQETHQTHSPLFESMNDHEIDVGSSIQSNPNLAQPVTPNTNEIKTATVTNSNNHNNNHNRSSSLKEVTDRIILDARMESSRNTVGSDRIEEILKEARMMTSSLRIDQLNDRSGLQTSNHNQCGTDEVEQGILDIAAISSNILLNRTSSTATTSPITPARKHKPTTLNVDIDDSKDKFEPSLMLRTKSIEETLVTARSVLGEAQKSQLEEKPTNVININYKTDNTNAVDQEKNQQNASSTLLEESPKVSNSADAYQQQVFSNITSPSDISVGSIEDFENAVEKLPSRFKNLNIDDTGQTIPCETILRRLDGIQQPKSNFSRHPNINSSQSDLSICTEDLIGEEENENKILSNGSICKSVSATTVSEKKSVKPVVIKSMQVADQQPEEVSTIDSWFSYFMGSYSKDADDQDHKSHDDVFPVSCGSPIIPFYEEVPSITTPLAQVPNVNGHVKLPSYHEVFRASFKEEPRLSDWVDNKFMPREDLPKDGTYRLGESKTIIVHEILRGNWTWCTAWSPDGSQLAIATENHHLAVVDTTSSSVWRVRHDHKVTSPPKQGSTQSIRSIAWGSHFIAIGGIGNAVSILAPTEPYSILHTITPTGFVGSMNWLPGTNKLLIGSRLGKAMLYDIRETDNSIQGFHFPSTQPICDIQSEVIHIIDRGKAWVNSVQFKLGEKKFAVGDSYGILGIYSFDDTKDMAIKNVANFKLEDSILDIQWSSDGKYVYAGGEDFVITVISTQFWEPVHRIKRDRWVQFISSSQLSSHLAVGGVTSEVSILDVNNGWDNVINISLKGLVPLSASWHPDDHYLVMTGQHNTILAIETTNARHISGHFLRSTYSILSVAFSPDGHLAAIGNEMGIVSLFKLSNKTFVSVYEMVVDCSSSLSIEWSANGAYLVIGTGNKVVIVAKTETLPGSTPPNTSGFFVAKVIRDLGPVNDISVDPTSRFLAVSGTKSRVLDATLNFKNVLEMEIGGIALANSWSHDGKWFAAIGKNHSLVIYDTAHVDISRWQLVFTVKTKRAGLALAWGPSSLGALQYCAYGGEGKQIHIMEIRTKERTWENVLSIPREGDINDLDWNCDGLVAAAISNGTVTILDLSYLQSGWAVNEMDYNWQRQALTCFTEIRRNRGKHSMKSVRWIPSAAGSNSFLAIGGTDGELEIIDLNGRDKCRGYQKIGAAL